MTRVADTQSDGEALILDPYRPYASMLIQRLYLNHGIRTVCLHRDWRDRLLLEGRHPALRSQAVSAHYMITDMPLEAVAQRLGRRHRIVGVLPYEEGMVAPLAAIAAHLGLSWAQPGVIEAFTDKFALKTLLAQGDPHLRLNVFAPATSAEDVLRIVQEHHLERFVLKPNSGSGNHQVAFFEADTDPARLQEYFAAADGKVLLEEFLEGPEFWVNGQMDEVGVPTVVGIGQYYRTSHNGIQNLEVGSYSVQPSDPRFALLRQYAEQVMRASGLRRSPFHLEAIFDGKGPCLVEVGARFCGELGAVLDMYHHGPQVDLIDAAAHYYVTSKPYGPLALDWNRVDRSWVGSATGTSDYDQRIVRVEGVDVLDASPNVAFWIKRPEPGDYVQRTTSLTTRAWALTLRGELREDPKAVIDWTRATVRMRGTESDTWTRAQKIPLYKGVLQKVWASRPRPYEAAAVVRPLR